MDKNKGYQKYSIPAAVCCLLWYVIDSWLALRDTGPAGVTAAIVFSWIIMSVIIVLLLIGKANNLVIGIFMIRTGITCYNVFHFYNRISHIAGDLSQPGLVAIKQFGAVLAFIGVTVEAIICIRSKKALEGPAILWTIPAWFAFASILASHILIKDVEFRFLDSRTLTLRIVRDCFEIAFFFFTCLWLYKSSNKNSTASNRVPLTDGKKTTLTDAERLKVCKELLDCGAITQEEFEKKKKEILSL